MKKIFVKRSVYESARELERVSPIAATTPYHLAEELINECRNWRDKSGERFWRDVWLHLMMVKHLPADIEIIEDNAGKPSLPLRMTETKGGDAKNLWDGYTIN
jgi:hypothetical protein